MQTSDNKMRTFNDFADEAFDIFCKSEIKVNILIIQSNLYAAYAFEEGCKAQSIKDYIDNEIMNSGKTPSENCIEAYSKIISLAPNPFSSPQNN